MKLEGLFSRESTELALGGGAFEPSGRVRVEVDHLQVGGVHDFSAGRARPFLAGLVGLTRYAAPDGAEVRFSAGVGTGAKFFATSHIGLRLDARVYITVLGIGGAGVCGGNGCAIAFRVSPAFQGDLTAGLIVAF